MSIIESLESQLAQANRRIKDLEDVLERANSQLQTIAKAHRVIERIELGDFDE